MASSLVSVPRSPSSSWIPQISGRRVLLVASACSQAFVLLGEDTIAESMKAIYRRALFGSVESGHRHRQGQGQGPLSEDGSVSLSSHVHSEGSSRSVFDQRGMVDCMVLASGKVLLTHRAMLAHRSNVLRDMIFEDAPTDLYYYGDNPEFDRTQPAQLLLPDLLTDTAKAFVYFLYTDDVPRHCIGNLPLLRHLQRCSREYRVPRLQVICENMIQALSVVEEDGTEGGEDIGSSSWMGEPPPMTLVRDMSSLLGDPQFADVRFVAEGKEVFAHRFILESRCDYFRTMFRSGMAETEADPSLGIISVVVPDSFVGFLRFLLFLYSNSLPDGSDLAVLEDLVSADRYGVSDMKLLCESMLCPTSANWLTIWHTANAVCSVRLQKEVLLYLRENIGDLELQWREVSMEFPDLMESVLALRQEAFPLPPSQGLLEQSTTNIKAAEEKNSTVTLTWWKLLIIVSCCIVYYHISRVIAIGPIVPYFNAVSFVGLLVLGYFYLAT